MKTTARRALLTLVALAAVAFATSGCDSICHDASKLWATDQGAGMHSRGQDMNGMLNPSDPAGGAW